MDIQDRELYKEAMKQFGKSSQIEMLIEELSELTLALQKFKRNPTKERLESVCEEIADVQIMTDQNKLIFPESKVKEFKKFKLGRLKATLSDTMYLKYQMDNDTLEDSLKESEEIE